MKKCSRCGRLIRPVESHYRDSGDPVVRVCVDCAKAVGVRSADL